MGRFHVHNELLSSEACSINELKSSMQDIGPDAFIWTKLYMCLGAFAALVVLDSMKEDV